MAINPEDLTLEQVKEQLALYTRLYHNLKKSDEDYIMKKRARALKYSRKKRQEKLLREGKAELDNDGNLIEPVKNPANKKISEFKYENAYSRRNEIRY